MTGQEIKNRALLLSGFQDIPDAYVISYINEIMDNLVLDYDEAGKKEITYLYGINGEWTQLPDNCVSLKRCLKNGIYDDFLAENGMIKFKDEGEFEVEYITMHDHITALTDTPDINVLYHEALAYGVAYKETSRIFMHEDMVEGNNKSILLLHYRDSAEKATAKIRGMKKSRKRIKFAPFM